MELIKARTKSGNTYIFKIDNIIDFTPTFQNMYYEYNIQEKKLIPKNKIIIQEDSIESVEILNKESYGM